MPLQRCKNVQNLRKMQNARASHAAPKTTPTNHTCVVEGQLVLPAQIGRSYWAASCTTQGSENGDILPPFCPCSPPPTCPALPASIPTCSPHPTATMPVLSGPRQAPLNTTKNPITQHLPGVGQTAVPAVTDPWGGNQCRGRWRGRTFLTFSLMVTPLVMD